MKQMAFRDCWRPVPDLAQVTHLPQEVEVGKEEVVCASHAYRLEVRDTAEAQALSETRAHGPSKPRGRGFAAPGARSKEPHRIDRHDDVFKLIQGTMGQRL